MRRTTTTTATTIFLKKFARGVKLKRDECECDCYKMFQQRLTAVWENTVKVSVQVIQVRSFLMADEVI